MLSKRLLATTPYLKGFHCLADCGTDHGYLPIYAVTHHLVERAIASDNKPGPLKNAATNVQNSHVNDKITLELANGLPYLDASVDLVSILGMGGRLIANILKNADLNHVKRLVLLPNSEASILRQALQALRWKIIDEQCIEDKQVVYEIIVAEPGEMNLTRLESLFGPVLLKTKPSAFIKHYQKQLTQLMDATLQIQDQNALEEVNQKIALLKEVLA